MLILAGASSALGQPLSPPTYAVIGRSLVVSLALPDPPAKEILARLGEGLESEIRYDIRVYQKATGPFHFLGDRFIGEVHPSYEARWDEFSREFIVTAANRRVHRFASESAFVAYFFSLSHYATGIVLPSGRPCYMLTSIEVNATKLVPPLNMISLLVPLERHTTAWERTPLAF